MTVLDEVRVELASLAKSPESVARFFKSGAGEYGESDNFLGVPNPCLRAISKKLEGLEFDDLSLLLESAYNEERLLALLVLVSKFAKAKKCEDARKQIFDFYVKSLRFVNNWNLVDLSAYQIVGSFLFDKDRALLFELAKSSRLWDRRVAVVSTLFFIKKGDTGTTYQLAEMLFKDKEDLMHKACGWVLREAGKKDEQALKKWLQMNASKMPRTMLRYAIEKFDEGLRQEYLSMKRDM